VAGPPLLHHRGGPLGDFDPMPDIAIVFLVGCALGFGAGYAVREHLSRKRRRRYSEQGR